MTEDKLFKVQTNAGELLMSENKSIDDVGLILHAPVMTIDNQNGYTDVLVPYKNSTGDIRIMFTNIVWHDWDISFND